MSQYLLPCSCGAKVPVSRSQAGMSLNCPECSSSLSVPTIRNLSQLEAVSSVSPATPDSVKKPGALMRIVAGLLLLLGIACTSYGGMMAYDRITFPIPLDHKEEDFLKESRDRVSELTPAGAWDAWNYMAATGLSEVSTPDYFRIQRAFRENEPYMIGFLAAGLGFLIAFAASVWFSRSRKS